MPVLYLRGASRESLAAAKERLDTLLAKKATDPVEVGDALFAVCALFDSSPSLGRALTDPSRESESKARFVSSLLADKVPAAVVDQIAELARARWSRSRDIADVISVLAATSVLAAAVRAKRLDTVEDELFRFGRTIQANTDLYAALSDRVAPAQSRADLVATLLKGKAAPETSRLAKQAVVAPRGRRVDAALADYAQIAAERREQLVAHVVVASPLRPKQRERLQAALGAVYDRSVHLNIDVDPSVLGGVRVEIGNEVLDGTITRRMDDARRAVVR